MKSSFRGANLKPVITDGQLHKLTLCFHSDTAIKVEVSHPESRGFASKREHSPHLFLAAKSAWG